MGGAASSSSAAGSTSAEAHEQESLAAASLALPLLRAVFSRSSDLPSILSPPPAAFRPASSPPEPPPRFHDLLARLGPAIASLFFDHGAADGGDWLYLAGGLVAAGRDLAASASTPVDPAAAGRDSASTPVDLSGSLSPRRHWIR